MVRIVIYLLTVLKYTNAKAKYSEINAASLCLGNISKDFLTDNLKRDWIICLWFFS